jgi:hypothetical protein
MQECASQNEAPAHPLMNMPSNRATPMHHVFLAIEFVFYLGAASQLTLTIPALIVAR